MKKKLYIETYGCQMNVADSEVVASVMAERNFEISEDHDQADVILVNTCSVRDNAEKRVWGRLRHLNALKKKNKSLKLGLIGCMAERIGDEMLEDKVVDIVAGPDAYRNLPYLYDKAVDGEDAINVELTVEETYDSIIPKRMNDSISGFVSITRGCNNFCTYCIVPYTRGRERSRDPKDILAEVRDMIQNGYKEVTLLGQNVDSYKWLPEGETKPVRFHHLLEIVAKEDPALRVRFSTPHPKDIKESVVKTIAKYPNICKHIHLPIQAGDDEVLKRMNRRYTVEWYKNRVEMIRKHIPDCSITTDVFCGFCGETEEQFQGTLDMMKWVHYDTAFMFKYSERPGTYAAKKLDDDISEELKGERLSRMIELQNRLSLERNNNDIDKVFEVLVEGTSKKSEDDFCGRSSQNKMVVFPKQDAKIGDYVRVKIARCTQTTLIGEMVEKIDKPTI
ncbi:tRNA (N6-isopentenyl adenosine(37)-C2)-methylthiotransferase MiaB [Halosquirtibacter laminarini]|uniref:tRNA (N6-isopentenyl adenosine(37)-C2)-methylthiotransferase MiaB n=1 Tax=Halosquirtibacter laminarini TaxID=3374600 RepID=A0AC61NCW0_9BACT|nr:tRNA (N6-isopentenyl adenosine(37)-C2)-methylthiotransferase MiaB [Prolixibacteraceae bacterium]